MMKRGQITVFIILGILLVLAVSVVIHITQVREVSVEEEIPVLSRQMQIEEGIFSFVDDCVAITAKDALVYVGDHGGFYGRPQNSLEFNGEWIPIYFVGGRDVSPSKAGVEQSIGKFVDDTLPNCLAGLRDFETGLTITADRSFTGASITSEGVVFTSRVPITIEWPDRTRKRDDFFAEHSSELDTMLKVKDALLEIQADNQGVLLLSDMTDLGINATMSWEISFRDNDVIIVLKDEIPDFMELLETITDKPNYFPKQLRFALRYDWE